MRKTIFFMSVFLNIVAAKSEIIRRYPISCELENKGGPENMYVSLKANIILDTNKQKIQAEINESIDIMNRISAEDQTTSYQIINNKITAEFKSESKTYKLEMPTSILSALGNQISVLDGRMIKCTTHMFYFPNPDLKYSLFDKFNLPSRTVSSKVKSKSYRTSDKRFSFKIEQWEALIGGHYADVPARSHVEINMQGLLIDNTQDSLGLAKYILYGNSKKVLETIITDSKDVKNIWKVYKFRFSPAIWNEFSS